MHLYIYIYMYVCMYVMYIIRLRKMLAYKEIKETIFF